MRVNYEIRFFQNGLVEYLNSSPIPIEIKRLVLAEVYNKVVVEADKDILATQSFKEEDEDVAEKENEDGIRKDEVE